MHPDIPGGRARNLVGDHQQALPCEEHRPAVG